MRGLWICLACLAALPAKTQEIELLPLDGALYRDIALSPAGELYLASDEGIKKLEADGTLSLVAGDGTRSYHARGDGEFQYDARELIIRAIRIGFDAEGNLYYLNHPGGGACSEAEGRVFHCYLGRITPEGKAQRIAGFYGTSPPPLGTEDLFTRRDAKTEGAPNYGMDAPMAIAPDGSIYYAINWFEHQRGEHALIYRVDPSGVGTAYAGNYDWPNVEELPQRFQFHFTNIQELRVSVDGTIFALDRNRIVAIRSNGEIGIVTSFQGLERTVRYSGVDDPYLAPMHSTFEHISGVGFVVDTDLGEFRLEPNRLPVPLLQLQVISLENEWSIAAHFVDARRTLFSECASLLGRTLRSIAYDAVNDWVYVMNRQPVLSDEKPNCLARIRDMGLVKPASNVARDTSMGYR